MTMNDYQKNQQKRMAQHASYVAQQDPTARKRGNFIVGCLVVPLILAIVGVLVVFFLQHPNGIQR